MKVLTNLDKVRYPLYLPKHIKEQLEQLAYKKGLSLNSIIILSINDYLEKEQNK